MTIFEENYVKFSGKLEKSIFAGEMMIEGGVRPLKGGEKLFVKGITETKRNVKI